MKNATILPVELVEFTYEHHFRRMSVRSRAIYLIVLIFLALSFTALFFVSVNVIVKGSGMLTASGERSWVKTPVSGRVAAVYVKENQAVKKGQLLFTMESAMLEEDFSYLRKRKGVVGRKIADLRKLVVLCRKKNLSHPVSVISSLYMQQYHLFKQEMARASNQLRNAAAACRRNESLFRDGVLAPAEFEKYRFALQEARGRLRVLYEDQGSRWQAALNELTLELGELASREKKLNTEREFYTVRAPAGGILQEMEGLHPGSFLSQGERVARLSPDSGLLARIFISPGDIGLVKEGMPVRIQVDAFNYQQWGMVSGTVSDISGDVLLAQDRNPFFEVKCKLEETALALDNGYRGRLKRGMTFQARFLVAERTLFQLLHDNIDDWLDPYEQNEQNKG